jgi:DUF4097 and DUF4098 domain-containing protein YvlB
MRNYFCRAGILFGFLLASTFALGQGAPQVINVPLSSPGEPLTLEIDIVSARIEVIGEDRADVEIAVTAEEGSRKIITPSGTKTLTGVGYSLEIDEDDNYVTVDTDWRVSKVSIVARIPRNANLILETVNGGEILVRDISGDLQLENVDGPITATGIAGSVVAETVEGSVTVSFTSIDASKAMALTSINGNLDLGIPANAGVQLHIDSAEGEIYSDFEVEVQPSKPIIERNEGRSGVEVRVESVIVADVNGGGTVIRLTTLNGDIQVRNSGQ